MTRECISRFNEPKWEENPGNSDYGYWVYTVRCDDCNWSHEVKYLTRNKATPDVIDLRKRAAPFFRYHYVDVADRDANHKMRFVGTVERPRVTHEYWIANIHGEWPDTPGDRWVVTNHLNWGGSGKNWFVLVKNSQGFKVRHSRLPTYEAAYAKVMNDLAKIESRHPNYNVVRKEELKTVEVEAPIASVTTYVENLIERVNHTNNLERLMQIDKDMKEFIAAADMVKAAHGKVIEKLLG